MKYRKKPFVVEAFKWTADHSQTEDPEWIIEALKKGSTEIGAARIVKPNGHIIMLINTLEGQMTANCGDYIIKGIKGGIYPCKPYIFELTYEEVKCEN